MSPGGLDTELWKYLEADEREKMYKAWADLNPTGHAGAEEVAESYLWLLKDSNVTERIAASGFGSFLV